MNMGNPTPHKLVHLLDSGFKNFVIVFILFTIPALSYRYVIKDAPLSDPDTIIFVGYSATLGLLASILINIWFYDSYFGFAVLYWSIINYKILQKE